MADVTKVAADGIEYNIKDETARSSLASLTSRLDASFAVDSSSVASGGTIEFTIDGAHNEGGIIVTYGTSDSVKDIIIYYTTSSGNVTSVNVRNAADISVATAKNKMSITNNASTYLFAMRFKRA